MVLFKVNVGLIAAKFSRLTWEECGQCPVFACYALEFALQLRKKHGKKASVRVVEKCQWARINVSTWPHFTGRRQVVDPYLPALADLVQRSVSVGICRTP